MEADLFSGQDLLMPPGKFADIIHWSRPGSSDPSGFCF